MQSSLMSMSMQSMVQAEPEPSPSDRVLMKPTAQLDGQPAPILPSVLLTSSPPDPHLDDKAADD